MNNTGRKRQPTESRRTVLLALLTFGILLVLVVVFVIRPTAGVPSQANDGPANSTDGQVLFEAYCAACHGKDGQPVVPDARILNANGETWRLSNDEIGQMIRNGSQLMPAMGADFSDEQVDAVITYIKAWWTPDQRAEQPGSVRE